MTNVQYLDSVVQGLRGVAGSMDGQTYDIRRLSGSTNVAIASNAPVISGFQARPLKAHREFIEGTTFELLAMEMACDNRTLLRQDVATENGYKSDGGVWTVAQMRPLDPTIWIRTERVATITRPMPPGGRASQASSGNSIAAGYLSSNKKDEQVLTLTNGVYAFAESGATAASVQVGLQMSSRVRDGSKDDAGGSTSDPLPTAQFIAYIPLVPDETLRRLDILNIGADRYAIQKLSGSGEVGLTGYVCVCDQIASRNPTS
jgi:hypothetical protein